MSRTVLSSLPVRFGLLALGLLPSSLAIARAGAADENLIPNGDFSKGNEGFTTGLPYVQPSDDCLWPCGYTIAARFDAPHLHELIRNEPFGSPVKKNGKEKVFFANAGGTEAMPVWSAKVKCKPKTQYLISFNCISLSGQQDNGNPPRQTPTMEWVPDFYITANGQQGAPFPAGCGEYHKVRMTWNSGTLTSATIQIVRDRIAHGGGLIGIANIEMVPLKESAKKKTDALG